MGINGVFALNWWQALLFILLTTHITIVSVTLFLHRAQAHRALVFHPIVSHFFRAWLWLTTGMETKVWVSIHRKHHAKCETPEDPHSPQVYGLKTVLWEGAELYRRERANKETMTRYGHGTPDDWLERYIYANRYPWLGTLLLLLAEVICFGAKGITIWAVQMAWIPFFAAGIINGIGHALGYRNFESEDASTNVLPIGLIIGGEELHNNHHTYPTSAKLSVKWWEFDVGWLYITLLKMLGLASVKRRPPLVMQASTAQITPRTLKSLLSNRISVMTDYTKTVLLPALDTAKQHASHTQKYHLKKMRHAVKRTQASMQEYKNLLKAYPTLDKAYMLKKKLQDIWDDRTASQKELLEALSLWCQEAEASGIYALKQFANYLRRYEVRFS